MDLIDDWALTALAKEFAQMKADAIVAREIYENHAKAIEGYLGFLAGKQYGERQGRQNETAQEHKAISLTKQSIKKEIKDMLVELKITEGSVRIRKNGLLEYRSQALGSVYGRTVDELQHNITKKIRRVKNEQKLKQKKTAVPLFSTFFDNQYYVYKRDVDKITEASWSDILIHRNFIVNQGYDLPLDQYTNSIIEKFLLTIPSTHKRKRTKEVFNNLFNYAKRIGVITSNPCDNVEKVKHIPVKGSALSFAEQSTFFDNLFSAENITQDYKLLFAFLYLTGCRRGEAMSLTTKDVDFTNNTLHINGTKTAGSNRTIPLTPLVKELLQKITPTDDGLYFPLKGERIDENMRKVKDNTHHPHELRHTYGTIQICVNKLDPKTVSLYMGHTTIDMTLTIYTHPEQLNNGVFLNGALSENEKLNILRGEYQAVLDKIKVYIDGI